MKKVGIVLMILKLTFIASIDCFATENPVGQDSIRYWLPPVVVTGQRYEMPQKDVAASISVISPVQIGQTHLTTVADVISYLAPGVFTTRRSVMGYGVATLAGGSITIRGLGGKPNTQVLMLIDGRPDFQGIFSHPINDAYFLDNVDHIEVLRGPASAVYGTNALGGVINIITRQFPTSGFNTQLDLSYGSYNTQRYRFHHAGTIGKFQYFMGIGYQRSDGHRKNGDFNAQNYALKIGYQINSNFKISFNGSITPYEFHDPGPENISLSGYFDYGDITRSSMDLTLTNKYHATDGTIKIHGNFGNHKLSDGWNSDDQTNGVIIFQNFNFPSQVKTTVGFDIKRYGGTARSSGTKLGTFFNDELAAYLHVQKILLNQIILGSGIRYEHNSHFGSEWIPKFSLVYHPWARTALRTTVAKGFRTPSIKDLYLYLPANNNLKPERLWSYEFGINQSLGKHFSLDVCSYYYDGDQLIEMIMIAQGKMKNQNIGSNTARGFEATLQANPTAHLAANLSYSFLDSDETIPFAPNKFNFMVNYQFHKLNISIFGEYIYHLYTSYQLNQMPPKTTLEELSDYTLAHLKLSYRFMDNLYLTLNVDNLFDQSYQILKGYPMPGRSIFSNLIFSF